MKVSDTTLRFLRDLITGDGEISYYQSGPMLVDFFKKFGFNDQYGKGFPSRWKYTEEKLKALNKQDKIEKVLITYLRPINWINNEKQFNNIINTLNKYLNYEDYEIIVKDKEIHIIDLKTQILKTPLDNKLTHSGIQKTLIKCERRIKEGDYEGAITASRALLETLLLYFYRQLKKKEYDFDGKLPKLFKDVLKLLNLTINSKTQNSIKRILSGLISIIDGISEISNKEGDRHGKLEVTFISKEYATLVLNATKTVADFLFIISFANLDTQKKGLQND